MSSDDISFGRCSVREMNGLESRQTCKEQIRDVKITIGEIMELPCVKITRSFLIDINNQKIGFYYQV